MSDPRDESPDEPLVPDAATEEALTELDIPSLRGQFDELPTIRIELDEVSLPPPDDDLWDANDATREVSLGGLPPPPIGGENPAWTSTDSGSDMSLPIPDTDSDIDGFIPSADAPEDGQASESSVWRGLHPASLLVNLIPQAWRTMKVAWWWLLAIIIGTEGMGVGAAEFLVLIAFAGLSVWNTFIHWATLRYRVHRHRLEITSGLLNRRFRTIDPERIQNVELVQNLFHKWTGLVELRVETAGDASTEGLLSALSVNEARRLRQLLAASGSLADDDRGPESGEVLVQMSLAEILAYGLSRRTIGTVAVMTAVGLEVMGQFGPDATQALAAQLNAVVIFAAFLLAFAGSWVASVTASLLKHHRFRLVRRKNSLWTEAGLATRRRVEIPLSKVQLVRTDEPMLRRWMGYGTVMVETAGLGVSDGRVRQAEGVMPMVEQDQLGPICQAAAPRADIDPWSTPLWPAHPRALYRGMMNAIARASFIAIPLFVLLGTGGWVALLLIPIAIPSAWLDWKKQGWMVTDQAIVSRRGFFNRRTFVLARDKLQSVHLMEGPIMRMHGLGRLVVRVAGSQIALPDIGKDEAARVMAELAG